MIPLPLIGAKKSLQTAMGFRPAGIVVPQLALPRHLRQSQLEVSPRQPALLAHPLSRPHRRWAWELPFGEPQRSFPLQSGPRLASPAHSYSSYHLLPPSERAKECQMYMLNNSAIADIKHCSGNWCWQGHINLWGTAYQNQTELDFEFTFKMTRGLAWKQCLASSTTVSVT